MEPSKELRDLVLGWYHDGSTGDITLGERMFSMHPGTAFVGTDPEEWWVGGPAIVAIIRRQLDELGGPIAYTAGRLQTFVEGTVGWIFDDPVLTLPDGTTIHVRITYVVHKEQDGWKVVHGHASIGADTPQFWGRPLTTSIDAVAELVDQERPNMTPIASPRSPWMWEGTVTIMFTDMEASTATNEALGDDRFVPLLLKHNEIVRQRTESFGGTVVKSEGDGFMVAFQSARRSVECAIAVQGDVAALDERIRVRMGLHTGEPVRFADDFFGRDVAYAARLGSAATGGEILVSALVKSLIEPSGSFSFDGPRLLELKGFNGPQPIFAVKWGD